MNYFELFDIPVQLQVNKKELYPRYIALSKQYHPDYHTQAGEEGQAKALEMSALLNKAWKTFQQPDEVIKYVLQEKGLLEEEEKYDMPPDFLMEVLEINDQLMELEDDDAAAKAGIQSSLNILQNDIYEPVKKIVESYQEGVTSKEELLQVKAYYYKKKYLDRISRQLAGIQ